MQSAQDVLDRMHRFLRLSRKLGWDIYDLDNAIMTLTGSASPTLARVDHQLLRQLAAVNRSLACLGERVGRLHRSPQQTPCSR